MLRGIEAQLEGADEAYTDYLVEEELGKARGAAPLSQEQVQAKLSHMR